MLQRLPKSVVPYKQAQVETRIRYPYSPSPHEEWRLWLSVGLMLTACWLVLSWPWLSGHVTIPWDGKAHFQAQISFLAQSIHRGESPFWAPFVFAGHPQIADPQSQIFSPPYLLLALFTPNPTFQMVDGVTLAMLLFGGFGVLGFARDRHWHPAAALVAALAFTWGGSSAWRVQHIGQILSIVYFPWALWMLERGLRLNSARYGALSGLFAALILLDPDQVAFLGLLTLAGYVIAFWVGGPERGERARRSWRPLIAGGVVGLAITAIPTLMVLSFAEHSNRAHFSIADAEMGSLHPSSLLTLVIANLFGTIGKAEHYWGAPSIHWPFIVNSNIARNMANFYMGLLPLAGMIIWLTTRQAYARRFMVLGVMFILMILYALGRYTPLFGIFYHTLPGVDLFRRPADSLFLVTALGAFLAGFGLDYALKQQMLLSTRAKIAVLGCVVSAFLIGIGMAIWLGQLTNAMADIAIAAGFVGATAGALAVSRRISIRHPLRVTALFASLLTFDYAWNLRPNDSTGLPSAEYDVMRLDTANDTIAELKNRVIASGDRRDRVEIAGLGFHWPNLGLIHRLESTLGYNPLRLKHFANATGAEDHVSGWDQHRFGPLYPSYRSLLGNMMGLRFIAIGEPIEKLDPRQRNNAFPLVARTKDGYIYENTDAMPRVMVVPEAQIVDQDQLVKSGQWPSTDLKRVVFIERTSMPLPRTKIGGTATILTYANTLITVRTDAPKGGVLLLNDIWHPWWFAEIDGKPTPMLRANGIFRAVILPAGVKEVTFRFEPFRGLIRRYFVAIGMLTP